MRCIHARWCESRFDAFHSIHLAALLVLAVQLPASSFAQVDGSIALYAVNVNPDGTAGETNFAHCAYVTPLHGGAMGKLILRVYATLPGGSAAALAGAEFYVDGLESSQLPLGWTKTVVTPASTFTLGDLTEPVTQGDTTTRGGHVVVPILENDACPTGPRVLLAQIELTSGIGFTTDFEPRHRVHVVSSSPPSNPVRDCPVVVLCPGPLFTAMCTRGLEFSINDSCPEAINNVAWSQVKDLYRE